MAVSEVAIDSSLGMAGYSHIALTADTLPSTGNSTGDRAKILDGSDKIWDGDSWETETGESLGTVSLAASTPFRDTSVGRTDQTMKASAGKIVGLHIYNPNSVDCFFQLYDAATVTVNSDAPTYSVRVPALGYRDLDYSNGLNFATQIHYAASTVIAGTSGDPTTALELAAEYI